MSKVSFGEHFDAFIARQIAQGRFRNESDVIRAGLRLLENDEMTRLDRMAVLAREINQSFDEGGSDRPASDVFDRLERQALEDRNARLHGA